MIPSSMINNPAQGRRMPLASRVHAMEVSAKRRRKEGIELRKALDVQRDLLREKSDALVVAAEKYDAMAAQCAFFVTTTIITSVILLGSLYSWL